LILEPKTEQEHLAKIVRRFQQKKILVIGDLVADQFLFGAISRVSREAPVMILRYEKTLTVPGGAANCAVNLASLLAEVKLIGVVGKDEAGDALLKSFSESNIDTDGVIQSSRLRTTTKVRVLAGQIHSPRQQVIRIDYENEVLRDTEIRQQLIEKLLKAGNEADAIIISDYNYGVADELIAEQARLIANERNIPLLVDSRFKLSSFAGCTSATPNEDEVEQLLNKKFDEDSKFENECIALREQLCFEALLVTRGGNGMLLIEKNQPPKHISAVGSREPVDVTGAGDTVIATYTLALASGATFAESANLANYAGGLVVMKRGTASINSHELLNSILN